MPQRDIYCTVAVLGQDTSRGRHELTQPFLRCRGDKRGREVCKKVVGPSDRPWYSTSLYPSSRRLVSFLTITSKILVKILPNHPTKVVQQEPRHKTWRSKFDNATKDCVLQRCSLLKPILSLTCSLSGHLANFRPRTKGGPGRLVLETPITKPQIRQIPRSLSRPHVHLTRTLVDSARLWRIEVDSE